MNCIICFVVGNACEDGCQRCKCARTTSRRQRAIRVTVAGKQLPNLRRDVGAGATWEIVLEREAGLGPWSRPRVPAILAEPPSLLPRALPPSSPLSISNHHRSSHHTRPRALSTAHRALLVAAHIPLPTRRRTSQRVSSARPGKHTGTWHARCNSADRLSDAVAAAQASSQR